MRGPKGNLTYLGKGVFRITRRQDHKVNILHTFLISFSVFPYTRFGLHMRIFFRSPVVVPPCLLCLLDCWWRAWGLGPVDDPFLLPRRCPVSL